MSDEGWIAVSDALPTEPGSYLVFIRDDQDGDFMIVTDFDPQAGWSLDAMVGFGRVSYWMPLPEPPHQ